MVKVLITSCPQNGVPLSRFSFCLLKAEVRAKEKKDSEEKTKKGEAIEVEEVSDADTENLELSEEEKETEVKAEKKSEHLTAQRMKNVNERKLATLKVKGTPYTSTSDKPKRVKHTAGKHRVHGRKPPLHPSSKRPESPTETSPAQNLRSSKRLRTDFKPL
ncbi:hypothetical protein JCGZ_26723 [Jatropha curcas]|uniref:Uncharacterized protein n=1 Tax=Jatropha curcas TaxID=180498 RepID=A0A067JWV4_JATCU|nr:hypothetical protein JCGZ_26723 [Jatropha curcas]